MKQQVFSIQDNKTAFYHLPFFSPTHASGVRSFLQLAQDSNSLVSKYPGDFSLFHIGEFDDESGQLSASMPVFVCSAVGVLANVKE